MGADSCILQRERVPTPQSDYAGTLAAVAALVRKLEQLAGVEGLPVGIGHPGATTPATGLLKNANSVYLNGRPFKRGIEELLGREVRMANDADCLAMSEASDGAAAGADNVFAVILGTGVGGGIAIHRQLLRGANAVAGEWGHNPLPWARPEWDEIAAPACWCGQAGCIETWLSGPGMSRDHARVTGENLRVEDIVARSEGGDERCGATLSRYEDRLARALAQIVNVLDPQVIVLGGGVSHVQRLYRHVPALWDQWIFSDHVDTRLVQARYGDSSGVRGAAWLWPAAVG